MVAERPEGEDRVRGDTTDRSAVGSDDRRINPQWARRAESEFAGGGTATMSAADEIKRLKRENAELKRANAILQAASGVFAAEFDRLHG